MLLLLDSMRRSAAFLFLKPGDQHTKDVRLGDDAQDFSPVIHHGQAADLVGIHEGGSVLEFGRAGNEIDAITGATISSKCVVNMINNTVADIQGELAALASATKKDS